MRFYDAETDGLARYHASNVQDGKYIQTGSCALGIMIIWTDRKATAQELSRVQSREPIVAVVERAGSPLQRAFRSTGAHDLIIEPAIGLQQERRCEERVRQKYDRADVKANRIRAH